jgi:thymidylate synthase ThyX
MSISAEIIADSINPKGCRLTTWVLEYPRFIHSELMTHRMFSKNAASSRAIPIETMIQRVIDDPAMPVWWGKNQSGMQAKEELDDVTKTHHRVGYPEGEHVYQDLLLTAKEAAKHDWLAARNVAIESVRRLSALGLHKQIANRILEPWTNIRVILSGTEFENFFALRAHPDAQPEFQALAYKMLEAYNTSEPKRLQPGEWHIPFGDKINEERLWGLVNSWESDRQFEPAEVYYGQNEKGFEEAKIKIAIARCARISYLNFEGKDDYAADIKLCDRLFGSVPRHLSPTEHVAQCMNDDKFIANFKGWKQYRYTFNDQNLSDPRVVRKQNT